jgi:NAD(P)-dependent dehydrogenase (short-subunit alcohol dehydrogenase family)
MSHSIRRGIAALAVGAALGATSAAGIALLLYTGQGFLRAAGLLASSTIMAVAAGIWAGGPDPDAPGAPVQSRGRWAALILVLLAGGAFTAFWGAQAPLRGMAVGGAFAVMFVLALPAYAAGALMAALHTRERIALGPAGVGSVAAVAAAGAAIGVLLATTVLIQTLEAYGIYYAAAGLLVLASMLEWQRMTGGGTMNDHVSIITGVGNDGQVGYAVARRFVEAGARVLITDRSGQVEALAANLGAGERVVAVTADLLDEHDVQRLMTTVRERFGRLDSLVNVAGGLSVTGAVADTTPEQWIEESRRNTETALRVCQAALPLLRESKGAIVTFAAPAAERAVAGLGAYSAAKAGVLALTQALAAEEKPNGVRANAIAPGMVDTAQNRSEGEDDVRYVSRDDVASVALFLAGPDSRGVTGEMIRVLAASHR